MKQKICEHKDTRYLDKEQIWYCPDCGQIFGGDPNEPIDDGDPQECGYGTLTGYLELI